MRSVALVFVVACGGGGSEAQPTSDKPEPAHAEPADARPIPGIDLAEVDATGYRRTEVTAPLVAVSRTELTVDGKRVAELRDGELVLDALEDKRPDHMRIPKLIAALAAVGDKAVMPRPPLVLAVDRTITYATLIKIMFSAKQKEAGWTQFSVLATSGGKLVAMPITLPDKAPPAGGDFVASGKVGSEPPPAADAIVSEVKAYAGSLRRCYTAALARDPAMRGRVQLTFDVDATGRVAKPQARGFDAGVDRCIVDKMSGWRFPPQEAVSHFTVPLDFNDTTPGAAPSKPASKPASTDDDAARLAELLTTRGKIETLRPSPVDQGVLRMVVSVSDRDIVVWSLSMREGSLQHPLATLTRDAASAGKVHGLLAGLAKKYYGGKARHPATLSAMFMADAKTPMSLVAPLLGAIRGGEGDAAAFPDVQLSSGFQ
jgi:hypothetical protein